MRIAEDLPSLRPSPTSEQHRLPDSCGPHNLARGPHTVMTT